MFRIVLLAPEIPPNTGNAIRLAANTGAELHLVEPLGFSLGARDVRRAGLDYHELAEVRVHADLDAAWAALLPARVFAFATTAERCYADIAYASGDVLLFGAESTGLPAAVQQAPQITDRVRLPMLPDSRSLNLSNTVAVAVYEAWRQQGFRRSTPPVSA
ncbi:tRNA (cytidine(34)-2'-O)-methyltransferase [Pseudonocardia asaccharolytica]|uniref:Putative tRNA (cytidine(34)-2'-O)-methyltransferase n=1 Tax=Pseudonocardia asaccharolytica DSM 44247 = NBRC 16224 TaxID=1123024 RepID=A0A511D185_9PSEU|nr:tRNA (cytidine(34)-2'-O)-methyltransferase [Pseudonocardia asaccharolytica]GEL18531.1 putative tRNA (cytidine(34)-2'-O)-methyltransferase [Pseudonocardia asaccharolytica DSM 44247 = NBRC 16224]